MPLIAGVKRPVTGLACLGLIIAAAGTALAQVSPSRPVWLPDSQDLEGRVYERTIDSLLGTHPTLSPRERFHIMLRFLPRSEAERQIDLSYELDYGMTATIKVLPKSVFSALSDLGKEAFNLYGKPEWKPRVEQFIISPDVAKGWLGGFFQSIGESGHDLQLGVMGSYGSRGVTMPLDTPTYQVIYLDSFNQLDLTVVGPEINQMANAGVLPLVKWMASVSSDLAKQKKGASAETEER